MHLALKIVLLIDYVGSGGAQRQLLMLARALKQSGAEVEVLTFFQADFFQPQFEAAAVPVRHIPSNGKLQRVLEVRRAIRSRAPDVLIAFLKTPNILAELAGLPWRSFQTIVSERNTDISGLNFDKRLRFFLHRFADAVVVNSHAQYQYMASKVPYLRHKVEVISNCVDLQHFQPAAERRQASNSALKILVLGRVHPQKDPIGLGKALVLLATQHPALDVQVDWYGEHIFIFDERNPHREDFFRQVQGFIADHGLQQRFRLHRPQTDVLELYHRADVLCLASHYEGCSNVLGEAMACGLPVIASRAGDNQRLVIDSENGLLVDPGAPGQLADAIARFCALDADARAAMGMHSRRLAEQILSQEVFAKRYTDLIERLCPIAAQRAGAGQTA